MKKFEILIIAFPIKYGFLRPLIINGIIEYQVFARKHYIEYRILTSRLKAIV
jgi:hypothetical protein